MAILSSDSFSRGNQSGFGTASDGESWTFTGQASTNSIASNEGLVKANGNNDTFAHLGSQTSADQEVMCRMAIGDHSGDICGVLGRFTDGNNTYKLLYYSGDIHINKSVSGSGSNLANYGGLTLTNGTFYQFKLKCVGTTITGKVWDASTAEPGSWMMTVTDSGVASGGFAILANTSSSAGIQFDTFAALDTTGSTRTIGATAALQSTLTRTVSSTVALQSTLTRTISSDTALQSTLTRTMTATAALQSTSTHTVSSTAALQSTLIRTMTATAALQATNTHTVSSTASLQSTLTRTIAATAALQSTLTRTVPGTTPLISTNTRTISATAALFSLLIPPGVVVVSNALPGKVTIGNASIGTVILSDQS
jgi:hypothetical protein